MIGLSFWGFLGLLFAAAGVSLVILWIVGRFITAPSPVVLKAGNAFLFHQGTLTDSDCDAAAGMDTWGDLRRWLDFRFDGLPRTLPELPDGEAATFSSTDDRAPATLEIIPLANATRITLDDNALPDAAHRHEILRRESIQAEHITALNDAPYAICKTGASGHVLWQNAACHSIHAKTGDNIKELIGPLPDPGQSQITRISVNQNEDAGPCWYEVQTTAGDASFVHYAIDITRVVQAEKAQREFVQTLTKTFANLTTGLAMFDRNRQLALFNPALIDLTALSVEFLSARPSLMSFFDRLRDRQVMPEPKNYADWRAQINHVIETASDGLYLETWTLPTGVTYRVTGRPHPDGAMAFLFEDITAEISLTRRFRAQLDIRQSVLDALDEAVVVIAPNNVVMFCNQASTALLGIDPDTSFAEMSTRDLLSACDEVFPDPGFWESIRTHINHKSLDPVPNGTVTARSGAKMNCRVVPVSGGAAMLCLSASSVHHPAETELLPM